MIKDTFTEDEWFLLLSTPSMIGASVAAAGQSGLGTIKEAVASLEVIAGAGKAYPNNELITELVKRVENRDEARAQGQKYQDMAKAKLQGKKPEQLTQEMLNKKHQGRSRITNSGHSPSLKKLLTLPKRAGF
jgi:hypothetical protein